MVLETLDPQSRVTMLQLFNSSAGVNERLLPLGMQFHLKQELVKLNTRRLEVYLDSPLVSYATQSLVTADGALVRADVTDSVLLYLERDTFVTFAELLKSSSEAVESFLAEMAGCLDSDFWESAWFKSVLEDNLSVIKAIVAVQYQKAAKERTLEPREHLRLYLRMWRKSVTRGDAREAGRALRFVRCVPDVLWSFCRTGQVQANV